MPDTLYVWTKRCSPESLDTEVAGLLGEGDSALSLVMAPTTFKLCVWQEGSCQHRDGDVPLGETFEVCVFCELWELRWVRDGCDGVASLLSERNAPWPEDKKSDPGWGDPSETPLAGVAERRYLLWGEVRQDSSVDDVWLKLGSQRTGPITIPFPFCPKPQKGDRIQLLTREYLAKFKHGNVCVFDQRLLTLVVAGNDRDRGNSHE